MELLQASDMPRYGNYDLSVGSSNTKWYHNRKTYHWLSIIGIVLLVSVGLFIGGYFLGTSKADDTSTSLPIIDQGPQVEWDGSCPKREMSCPSSYQGIPPLLLVSLDGFRPDYLTRGITPTLTNLSSCGSSAPFMYPVFPSKTFPNHYSIVTGMYPSSHGIIDNNMFDPEKRKVYKVGKPEYLKPYWYEAEPIWVTAQNQGKRSSLYFWPGSEVEINGVRPNDYVRYKVSIPFERRVNTILQWLDRPVETRPNFLTLYVNEPDKSAHGFGISSKEVNDALVRVDVMITRLLAGLQSRKLLNCVNIIILSDHGLVDISCKRTIILQDYGVKDSYSFVGSFGRIRPRNESVTETMISNLQCKNDHMRVYPKEQLPVRFHYANHSRIEPIYVELDAGWSVFERPISNCLKGSHGYDNYFNGMAALFMAHGPAFKFNNTIQPFINTELYELMCELLNITANPNNGTRGSLHNLLEEIKSPLEQEEYEIAETALVPDVELEYDFNIHVSNCSCAKEEFVQHNVDNETVLQERHVPFGMPYDAEDTTLFKTLRILYNSDYISAYDLKYRMTLWSSFTITSPVRITETEYCWRGDARVPSNSAIKCTDYDIPTVADGHIFQRSLFPPTFANHTNLEEALLVSNSVPKYENHILLIENWLLEKIAALVRVKTSLNIVAGPAFDLYASGGKPGIDAIMASHAKYGPFLVPTHYFYVISWCRTKTHVSKCPPSELDAMAFILPNVPIAYNCESPDDLIKKHAARIIDVEKLTGITFFTELPIYEAIRMRTLIPNP